MFVNTYYYYVVEEDDDDPVLAAALEDDTNLEDEQMAKLMGFSSFDSTKVHFTKIYCFLLNNDLPNM